MVLKKSLDAEVLLMAVGITANTEKNLGLEKYEGKTRSGVI